MQLAINNVETSPYYNCILYLRLWHKAPNGTGPVYIHRYFNTSTEEITENG